MRYEATIDSDTLVMFDRQTNQPLDAVAVIPDCREDLAALVGMLPRDMASELARMAAWRAMGMQAPPPSDFDP